ncbi:PREDICTED: uncharacterized protein LOC107191944 [Dufourea novaeangliae]|uniref:uncharacterized protein LOC107191944 n=1 Tax=Dufourea novaeangliae TaxID=178035 RepID=UPI0007679A2D|nr:PREDICTED: uncharacterized protein LOC107191944 [Dufourea novaeangliae]
MTYIYSFTVHTIHICKLTHCLKKYSSKLAPKTIHTEQLERIAPASPTVLKFVCIHIIYIHCCRYVVLFVYNEFVDTVCQVHSNAYGYDYEGQAGAEKLSRVIITLFGVVGFIWGYVIQQFSQTMYILGAGFVMAALITLQPWPMYRRKPLDWQKPQSTITTKLKKKKYY